MSNDRIIIEDGDLGYGQAVCIDCGNTGNRRLPARFPHICGACLFPVVQPCNDGHELPEMMRDLFPVAASIADRLEAPNRNLNSVSFSDLVERRHIKNRGKRK